MKVGCGASDLLDDQQREDKLVRIVQGKYYGHPNMKRAVFHNDPRQCVWRNPTEPTSANYEAPIGVELSAAAGIIEYKADHFNRQLRGNLIHVKYKSSLLRTVLSPDGLSANLLSVPGISLVGRSGLDVTQAPNGNLIEVRYLTNSIWVDIPVETATSALQVNSVFPSRGSQAGGTLLRIYGRNFGATPNVKVGTSNCPIDGTPSATYIQCTLPGGTGLQDVIVSSGSNSYIFQKGYRYITGF
jgi:IPT/TIG domain